MTCEFLPPTVTTRRARTASLIASAAAVNPVKAAKEVITAKDAAKARLSKQPANADIGNDHIPY